MEGGNGGSTGNKSPDAAAPAMTGKLDAAPPKEEPDADTEPPVTKGGGVKGGCACRVGERSDATGSVVLSAVFAAFVLVRRRRRR
jgi:MYXO-CTERM domain-containing protein